MSKTTVSSSRKRVSLQAPVVIQGSKGAGSSLRMSMSMGGGGGGTLRRNVMSHSTMPMERGQVAAKTSQAVRGVMQEKDKEKKEMGDLNQKLAAYIENRKYNEVQIQALKEENERLKNLKIPLWEDIRSEYIEEIESHREALAEAKNSLADLQAEISKLKEEVMSKDEEIDQLRGQNGELESRLKTLTTTIGDLEGEIRALRTEIENLSLSNNHLKQENQRLRDEIMRLTGDLEHARAEQIRAFNMLDQERAEKEFIEDTLQKEIEILQAQVKALRDIQPDYKKYFTTGFKDAVAEMQRQNDQIMADTVNKLEAQYEAKMVALDHQRKPDAVDSSVVRSENKNLKSTINSHTDQINKLKQMLESMQDRYDDLQKRYDDDNNEHMLEIQRLQEKIQQLTDDLADNDMEVDKLAASKLDLELEIATYRKLLDCETASLKNVMESSGNVQSSGGAYMANMIMSGGGSSGGGGSSSSASQNSNPDVSKPTKKSPSQGQPQKPKQPKTEIGPKKIAISQTQGKVNLQRKCRGSLQFSEVPTNGEFVEVENTNKPELDISGYTIKRDHKKGVSTFKFPNGTKLAGYKKCRVYGNAFSDEASMDAKKLGIECFVAERRDANNWGTGNGGFGLSDNNGVEKASATMTFT